MEKPWINLKLKWRTLFTLSIYTQTFLRFLKESKNFSNNKTKFYLWDNTFFLILTKDSSHHKRLISALDSSLKSASYLIKKLSTSQALKLFLRISLSKDYINITTITQTLFKHFEEIIWSFLYSQGITIQRFLLFYGHIIRIFEVLYSTNLMLTLRMKISQLNSKFWSYQLQGYSAQLFTWTANGLCHAMWKLC